MHPNQKKDNETGRFLKIYETPQEFEEAINAYLEKIGKEVTEVHLATGTVYKPILPTISGLAGFLGVDMDTLKAYERRPGYDKIYKRFRAMAEDSILQRSLSGEYQAAVSIFFLKNAFGYKDSYDVNAVAPEAYKPPLSANEILDKINDDKITKLLDDEE